MPTYRMGNGFVHLKMTNTKKHPAPAPCCARMLHEGRTVRCMAISTILCDWKLDDGRTCDAPLCAEHAHDMGKDRHLCDLHFALGAAADA